MGFSSSDFKTFVRFFAAYAIGWVVGKVFINEDNNQRLKARLERCENDIWEYSRLARCENEPELKK